LITPETDRNYLLLFYARKLHPLFKSKEVIMKKLVKLILIGVVLSTTLSACIVVPAGPGYYRPYHGPYYGH